jgi:hypothetical protein
MAVPHQIPIPFILASLCISCLNWRILSTFLSTSDLLKLKHKEIPVQTWTGPEDSRRLWLAEFLDNQHLKIVGLPVLRIGHLNPQDIFLVLISASG